MSFLFGWMNRRRNPPPVADWQDEIAEGRQLEEANRGRVAAERALAAALADLRDKYSEITHINSIARGFEDRALAAEERLRKLEDIHAAQMLQKWAEFGAQGGRNGHPSKRPGKQSRPA